MPCLLVFLMAGEWPCLSNGFFLEINALAGPGWPCESTMDEKALAGPLARTPNQNCNVPKIMVWTPPARPPAPKPLHNSSVPKLGVWTPPGRPDRSRSQIAAFAKTTSGMYGTGAASGILHKSINAAWGGQPPNSGSNNGFGAWGEGEGGG